MLQIQTVPPNLLLAARRIFSRSWSENFLLVGGTNVALRLGHRVSVDIDLFTNKEFDVRAMLGHFSKEFTLTAESIRERENGFRADWEDGNVIVDMYHSDMPMNREPLYEQGLRLANLVDVAAMKIEAMVQRRVKKDYIDLYFIFEELDPQKCLEHFHQLDKYCSPKSVTFALDEVNTAANNKSEMPTMLKPVNWAKINAVFKQVNREYTKSKVFEQTQPPRDKEQGAS